MNIFVLDKNPCNIAHHYCDKHVVKMVLETAQLLCSVHHHSNSSLDVPYKPTHMNHPCSIWARSSYCNYMWLCDLGMALCVEYNERFGKIHKSEAVIKWCCYNKPDIPHDKMSPWVQCVPVEHIKGWGFGYPSGSPFDLAVAAYRSYYAAKLREFRQRGICKFTRRSR